MLRHGNIILAANVFRYCRTGHSHSKVDFVLDNWRASYATSLAAMFLLPVTHRASNRFLVCGGRFTI